MVSEVGAGSPDGLNLMPSPRLLEMLGEIPYRPWQCIAELVDNSFDDFLTNPDQDADIQPRVSITLPKPGDEDAAIVCVADNGRGMDLSQLERALRAGYSTNAWYGNLGLFGMGFNIATARLGSVTEVRTTRAGDRHWLVAEINFRSMRAHDTFRVPLRLEPKDDPLAHGTEVTVSQLKPDLRNTLRRPQTATAIRDQLGKVYSYLLRSVSPIPEIPDAELKGKGFGLYVNGKRVKPRLPCVWSASRTVPVRGAETSAVMPINRPLPPAIACMACGHWHRAEVDECVECGGTDLELRERRIYGWLGVQRFLDSSDFGIDFLRNGRKILISDKSLFTWDNIDTGEAFVEYPIELPANQGRIVGEIHLDHVPVTYQKTDFDRASRLWLDAVTIIRGEGPLGQKKARQRGYPDNDSPLGTMYSAFRRNSPGLKCLIPGDGVIPLHELARQWGENFHKDLPDYLTDDLWYEAAREHDEVQTRGKQSVAGHDSKPDDIGRRTGLDEDTGGSRSPDTRPLAEPAKALDQAIPSPVETEDQRFARYAATARPLLDLRGDVSFAGLSKRTIKVFETKEPLRDERGDLVPCLSRFGRGASIEIYVHGDHEVFREYGRDPRDYALLDAADVIRKLAGEGTRITAVLAQIMRQFPDQKISDAALRARAAGVLGTIRELLLPLAMARPGELWNLLPNASKRAAEREGASANPRLDWQAAASDGRFATYLDVAGVAELVRAVPELLLDGAVFTTTWGGWSDEATRERQVGHVIRSLETVAEFLAHTGARTRLELAMARLALDALDDELVRVE